MNLPGLFRHIEVTLWDLETLGIKILSGSAQGAGFMTHNALYENSKVLAWCNT